MTLDGSGMNAGQLDSRSPSASHRTIRSVLEATRNTRGDSAAPVELLLAWADAGYYGRCSVCAGSIDAELLERDPIRHVCHDCADPVGATGFLR